MIRALLKKQLLELGAAFVRSSKTGKRRSRAGAFGYALLFAVLILLVMLSFGSMALPLAVTYHALPLRIAIQSAPRITFWILVSNFAQKALLNVIFDL